MTTVSAIIPTYNRTDLLMSRSLKSVLEQTRPVDEIMVVADGMEPDPFQDLLDNIGIVRRTWPVPVLVHNIERPEYPTDSGNLWSVQGWKARNTGLDMAQGDWVAPLDDDDEWTHDHIEVLLNAAIEKGVDFAYGKAVTGQGQWYGHWPPSGMNFTDGSQLYRHDMGYRYDPECLTRWLPADADLWNRMIADGVTFTFVDKLVHRYFPAKR